MRVKICGFLSILTMLSASAMAFEFKESTPEQSGFDGNQLNEIKAKFDELYLDGRIPNYAVGVYTPDSIIYSAANGQISVEGGENVNLDTIYWLASMTKPIVSTAIIKLVEEGKLSLDDKLSKFFPEFEDMLVAPGGSYDTTLESAKTDITLRHLISHTSGLTYWTTVTGVGDVAEQYDELGIMQCSADGRQSLEAEVRFLAQLPLIAHPGESWNYSISTDVLGAIIEQVTGKRLGVYLDEIIFQPLNMQNTFFQIPTDDLKSASEIYTTATAPQLATIDVESDIDWKIIRSPLNARRTRVPNCDSGGGGLFASVNDFAKYLAMIANGGKLNGVRVLSEESMQLHLRDQTTKMLPEAFRRGFGDDASSYMKFAAGFGRKMDVNKDTNSESVDYFFWGGAANTFFWVDVDNGTIGVFATQLAPSLYNFSNTIEEIVDQAQIK